MLYNSPLVVNQSKPVVGRHSRLATLLQKLADAMTTDGLVGTVTEKPRPLSLTSGAISDVEVGKVSNSHVLSAPVLHCCVFHFCQVFHSIYLKPVDR